MGKHMATKTVHLPQKIRDELSAAHGSVSELIRGLLLAYVDGKITIAKQPKDGKPTSFQAPPELLDRAVDKAKEDGIPLNKVIVELLHISLYKDDMLH